MPIVIMKHASSPVLLTRTTPECVWIGKKKDAEKWCDEKNSKNDGWTTYEAVTVKAEKPECKQKN